MFRSVSLRFRLWTSNVECSEPFGLGQRNVTSSGRIDRRNPSRSSFSQNFSSLAVGGRKKKEKKNKNKTTDTIFRSRNVPFFPLFFFALSVKASPRRHSVPCSAKRISGCVPFSNGCRLNRKTRITRWPGRKYVDGGINRHRRWDEMNQ